MYDRMIHEHGYSIRKLADKLGKDKGYLENRLRLADAPEEIRELVSLRKDTLSHAYELLKVPDPKKRRRLADQVARGELSLVKLRERIKATFQERYGVKITYLPMVVRATVDALLEYPDVNARLDGDNIVRHRFVNMGIAVSYDAGLIVPVIKGADGMNTIGVARAIADLAARARSHQLRPDEVQGATFTITNPGPYGSVASVPIINQPNVGILSFDAIVKRPVVIDDAIAIRSMVNISMSWDHRVIDGEAATRFLARVKENLETWDFAEDLGV